MKTCRIDKIRWNERPLARSRPTTEVTFCKPLSTRSCYCNFDMHNRNEPCAHKTTSCASKEIFLCIYVLLLICPIHIKTPHTEQVGLAVVPFTHIWVVSCSSLGREISNFRRFIFVFLGPPISIRPPPFAFKSVSSHHVHTDSSCLQPRELTPSKFRNCVSSSQDCVTPSGRIVAE